MSGRGVGGACSVVQRSGRYVTQASSEWSHVVTENVLIDLYPVPAEGLRARPSSTTPARRRRRTILIADDDLTRRGLLETLRAQPLVQVVGEYRDQLSLDRLLAHDRPDLVILDLSTRRGPGLTEVCELKHAHPDVDIVVVADEVDETQLLAAVCGGIDGIAARSSPVADLLDVVTRVGAGEPALDRHFSTVVMRALRRQHEIQRTTLTARERELLALVARGYRNPAIATRLFISQSTVKFHLRNVTSKLGAANRAEVEAIARRLGLG